MEQRILPYKNSSIHYCVFGNGQKLAFCFHGYGENAESFSILEDRLGGDFTFIALNMPFHGQTEWKEGLTFMPDELQEIIDGIWAEYKTSQREQITLVGFSMGGRVALQLLQNHPQKITRVILIAPDGLHKNFWYQLSTQTSLGNRLFSYAMQHAKPTFTVMTLAEKARLLHQSILKVTHHYLDNAGDRLKLYERWTTMRKFKPNLLLIKKTIAQYKIPVRFLFGRYDGIILSKRSDIFKGDTDNVKITVIDSGHRIMQEKHLEIIAKMFYE